MMRTAIMLFTRDLRLHDNPALTAACAAAQHVVPLFVLDDALLGGPAGTPNKVRLLFDCLADLRDSLRSAGTDLILCHGDPVTEALRVAEWSGAQGIFLAEDTGPYAVRRARRLADACAAHRLELSADHPGVTVIPPGMVTPAAGDHYRVFTPYWRAWSAAARRRVEAAPHRLRSPREAGAPRPGILLEAAAAKVAEVVPGAASPGLQTGGERAARTLMRTWLAGPLAEYEERRDDLVTPPDGTSRLSAHLRFGCLSPLELATAAADRPGGPAFLRQLAWRDFHHQVTAAFPGITRDDYRPRGTKWRTDPGALEAWCAGRTGYPIVDAGMRQLMREGWMHNRLRMITASFLTRRLTVDWREGLRHFGAWLADADVADNAGNWQWVAGTGNDTRPGRVLNPLRQAARFDPSGAYVRRYVPELGALPPPLVHRPWLLPEPERRALGYPAPLVEPG